MNLTPEMVASIGDMFVPCKGVGGCGHALRTHLVSGGGTGGCAKRLECTACATGTHACGCERFRPEPEILDALRARFPGAAL